MTGTPQPGPVRAEFLHGAFPAVVPSSAPEPQWEERHERAWRELCDQNQRLHDDPIWAVTQATATLIAARQSRYRFLALQDHPAIGDMGVRQLGVKGVTVAMDQRREPHILIARRGRGVRTYPGRWETAPAGGVDAHTPLSPSSVAGTLIAETLEELGVDASASLATVRFVAVMHDPTARSVELIATIPWPHPLDTRWALPPDREEAWEYSAARWLALGEAPAFLAATPAHELTPPARWILENARTLLAT